MNERFIYEYQLVIATPSRVNNFVIPQTLVSPKKVGQGQDGASPDGIVLATGDYLDYNTIPAEAWYIDDLQITAEVNQSKEQGVPCTVEVTNLDPSIVKRIRKGSLIVLRAGYRQASGNFIQTSVGEGREQLQDIMVAQVIRVTTNSSEVDKVTRIDCAEGITVKKNSRISKTFLPLTTREGVIRGLLDQLKGQGIPTGRFKLPPTDSREYKILKAEYLTGYSCQGFLMDELEKICNACSLRVFMAIGKVYIEPSSYTSTSIIPLPENTLSSSEVIFVVTPDNVKGEVDEIDGDSDNTPNNSDGNKDKVGLALTTYLDGNISIDKVMRLENFVDENEDKNGEYRITSVTHNLDYRGDTWETTVTLRQL